MLVEKPPHTFRDIRTFEERRQPQAEMVYSMFAVGLHLYILYNRELCQYQFAVVIFRNSRYGIDLLICKQTILLHRILTATVGKVILKVESKFICQFRQGIVGNIRNCHAGIVRIIIGPHIARQMLQLIERPLLQVGKEFVFRLSAYVHLAVAHSHSVNRLHTVGEVPKFRNTVLYAIHTSFVSLASHLQIQLSVLMIPAYLDFARPSPPMALRRYYLFVLTAAV